MSERRIHAWLVAGAAVVWRHLPFAIRRGVVHALNPKFLVGVVGVIHDGQGRVLLLEHRFRPPYPWGLPGGYIGSGETLEAGLRRELREEVALEVEIEPEIFDVELSTKGAYVSVALLARANAAPLRIDSREITGYAFVTADDIPAETYPHHAALVRRFFAR